MQNELAFLWHFTYRYLFNVDSELEKSKGMPLASECNGRVCTVQFRICDGLSLPSWFLKVCSASAT